MKSDTSTLRGLCLCGLICLIRSSPINIIELSKLSCTKPSFVPQEVVLISMDRIVQCGALVYSSNSPVMIVKQEANGSCVCGSSERIPLLTPCSDTDSKWTVFYIVERLMKCTGMCKFYYTFLGVSYCIHVYGVMTTYDQCNGYCTSLGGEMVEVRSQADLATFHALPAGLKFWVGANDFEQQGQYKWKRGDYVNASLWMRGEPNNSLESCVVLSHTRRLNDAFCWKRFYCMCALVCRE